MWRAASLVKVFLLSVGMLVINLTGFKGYNLCSADLKIIAFRSKAIEIQWLTSGFIIKPL
jgi:hypothetical protein